MAEPPPKKIGSLRDRIAAFENKTSTPAPASAPAPRPKPAGHVSWKPRSASPPPASDEPAQTEKKVTGAMSAADAKASIGAGGSLRERMAALQGRGGLSGSAPPVAPPKPATDKPKWKPPPQVVSPPLDEGEPRPESSPEHAASTEPKSTSEEGEQHPVEEEKAEGAAEEGTQEPDPEEEERQRRAAIAARMARLGGARVGMAPPTFGKKPDVPKKPSFSKADEPKEDKPGEDAPVSSPAGESNTQSPPTASSDVLSPGSASEQEYFAQKNTSSASLLSVDSGSTSEARSPAMPVPAVPRRAAPPRRKAPKSPSPAPPTPSIDDITEVSESPAAGTPQLTSDDTSKQLQEAVEKSKEDEVSLGLAPVTQPHEAVPTPHVSVPDEEEPPKNVEEEAAPEEKARVEEVSTPELQEKLGELAPEEEDEHVQEETPVAAPEPVTVEDELEEPEPKTEEAAPVEEEDEEDENERRKRIAERLKQQGGFNMFSAPPPPVRTSSDEEPPSRKASVDVDQSPSSPRAEEPYQPEHTDEPEAALSSPTSVPEHTRRQSTDSTVASLKSPLSPPLPPASSRPSVPERKDSHKSIGSPVEVNETDEADEADEDENQDDSHTIPFDNAHRRVLEATEDETEPVASEASPIEPEEYEDAHETHEEAAEAVEHNGLGSVHASPVSPGAARVIPPPPKRMSIPPPPRAVLPSPPPVSQAVEDKPEEVPPPPPKRVSLPPPPRSVPLPPPPPPMHDDVDEYDITSPSSVYSPEEARDDEHESTFSPQATPAVHPTRRSLLSPPSPVLEASDDESSYAEHAATPQPPPADLSHPETPLDEHAGLAYVDEPEEHGAEETTVADSQDVALTEEEEEAQRRQRIAERLRQQGALNPFGAPPPPPVRKATKPSVEPELSLPVASVDVPHMPASPTAESKVHEEIIASPPPVPAFRAGEDADDNDSEYSAEENVEARQVPEEDETPPPVPARHESLRTASASKQALPTLEIPKLKDREILDEAEGDPIDPSFYSPKPPSASPLAAADPPVRDDTDVTEPEHFTQSIPPEAPVEDEEQTRRRTIAERMAKLGGIRFGAPLPVMRPPPPPPPPAAAEYEDDVQAESPQEQSEEPLAEEEVEDEFARRQRIAARLAGMGGMRFGMLPGQAVSPTAPTPKSPPAVPELSETDDVPPPPPSGRPPPSRSAPLPPVPQQPVERFEIESESDGVQVEAEESEIEEVEHPDVEEEAPPPVPTRPARRGSAFADSVSTPLSPPSRPPVPMARPPVPITSRPVPSPASPHNDYVMVEPPEDTEEVPPPPPPRTVSLKKGPPARSAPPLPPPQPQAAETIAQWDSTVDFGGETDLSLSGQWSEDSTHYPAEPLTARAQPPSSASTSSVPPPPAKLSADDLMAQWGRVGVQVHEVATTLFEKSKRSLIGDGTYLGFVAAALNEVPNAAMPVPPYTSFGYLIYEQVGSSVHIRASDIMPGDIITLHEAKLKGHKGIQIYHQTVGVPEPACAIISDFETKKSKVKVFQANQHVGQQSVESVSYRLEDLKSGVVKIFRVLEA